MTIKDYIVEHYHAFLAIFVGAIILVISSLLFMPQERICLGDFCVSFGNAPLLSLLMILFFIGVFFVGFAIAFWILDLIVSHGTIYLWVGIFVLLCGIGLIILPIVQKSSGGDLWAFVGMAAFMIAIGLAMIIFPLIWPEKYQLGNN
ncbi:hypothetical protein HOC01_06245 [archaeon]|jgi:hypothetical protein|nr:hypothetical protein [archaeon]MBT6697557.1 hypothetical protein [archaeon]